MKKVMIGVFSLVLAVFLIGVVSALSAPISFGGVIKDSSNQVFDAGSCPAEYTKHLVFAADNQYCDMAPVYVCYKNTGSENTGVYDFGGMHDVNFGKTNPATGGYTCPSEFVSKESSSLECMSGYKGNNCNSDEKTNVLTACTFDNNDDSYGKYLYGGAYGAGHDRDGWLANGLRDAGYSVRSVGNTMYFDNPVTGGQNCSSGYSPKQIIDPYCTSGADAAKFYYCMKTITTVCGDGTVDSGEECDDGNTNNGDDCSSSCKWEDNDNDGVTADKDCDDSNVYIYPLNSNEFCDCDASDGYGEGRAEICDGQDSDCDGKVDFAGDVDICKGLDAVFWGNTHDEKLSDGKADLEDTVALVAKGKNFEGENIHYEIFKVGDGLFEWIRELIAGPSSEVEFNSEGVVYWKTEVSGTYYFEATVDGLTERSEDLIVSDTEDDSPMKIRIGSPACGSNFTLNDSVNIDVLANDTDDLIEGNLTINGDVFPFGNDASFSFDYNLSKSGEVKIVAYGVNSRGKQRRSISNVMVVDPKRFDTYIAACIDKPIDFQDIEGKTVEFNAVSSRAFSYDPSSGYDEMEDGQLMFDWTFSDLDANGRNRKIVRRGNESLSQEFTLIFARSGSNWAQLELSTVD